ncbi:MAG: TadE/TadG family type IV pilus assembly protein [Vicinamibacterales bacterium]
MKRLRNQRGAALLETAITIPIILLVSVSIFEFGRAYQTWQVLTNAAREGARVSVLAESTDGQVTDAVKGYMTSGRLTAATSATVTVERTVPFNGGANTASRITVAYPFTFIVLNPVMRLVSRGSTTGQGTTTMSSVALMRNEG